MWSCTTRPRPLACSPSIDSCWSRWRTAYSAAWPTPRAYLVRVVTRLALDRIRRIRARKETYIGPWLPEPVSTDRTVGDDVELFESISMALLVVLETLSPLERAVFVLREAFAFPYSDIAKILDRTEPAVRQLARRAREHIAERRPRFDADPTTRRAATERFLAACETADFDALLRELAPDVVLVADSGGEAIGPRRPLHGAEKVARLLTTKRPFPITFRLVEMNGEPAIVIDADDQPITAVFLDVLDGAINTIHVVANPAKLTGIPV